MQIKGLVGQGWVRASFSCARGGGVGVVVKDYQAGSDVLSLFTRGVAHKIRHTGGFLRRFGWAHITAAQHCYRQPSVPGVLHICLYTEMLCFKYPLNLKYAPGFSSPLQENKNRYYMGKITSKILYKSVGVLHWFCTETPFGVWFLVLVIPSHGTERLSNSSNTPCCVSCNNTVIIYLSTLQLYLYWHIKCAAAGSCVGVAESYLIYKISYLSLSCLSLKHNKESLWAY